MQRFTTEWSFYLTSYLISSLNFTALLVGEVGQSRDPVAQSQILFAPLTVLLFISSYWLVKREQRRLTPLVLSSSVCVKRWFHCDISYPDVWFLLPRAVGQSLILSPVLSSVCICLFFSNKTWCLQTCIYLYVTRDDSFPLFLGGVCVSVRYHGFGGVIDAISCPLCQSKSTNLYMYIEEFDTFCLCLPRVW